MTDIQTDTHTLIPFQYWPRREMEKNLLQGAQSAQCKRTIKVEIASRLKTKPCVAFCCCTYTRSFWKGDCPWLGPRDRLRLSWARRSAKNDRGCVIDVSLENLPLRALKIRKITLYLSNEYQQIFNQRVARGRIILKKTFLDVSNSLPYRLIWIISGDRASFVVYTSLHSPCNASTKNSE